VTVPNVAESRTIAEYTDTTGTSDYRLLGALPSSFRFRDAHTDGDSFDYIASDGPNIEIVTGTLTYGSPDILSRTTIQGSSNGGSKVEWSGVTRPILHEVGAASSSTATCVPAEIIDVYTGTSI
jgi:hypothetical protein